MFVELDCVKAGRDRTRRRGTVARATWRVACTRADGEAAGHKGRRTKAMATTDHLDKAQGCTRRVEETERGGLPGDVGLYPGEVGLYPGDVGLYPGLAGLYPGE